MAGRAQLRAGLALFAILLVSALVVLTSRFVGDESEPEIVEPEVVDGLAPAPIVAPSRPELSTADAGPGADVAFVPRPGTVARLTRQTGLDLRELEVVADHHDFTAEERRRVGSLLQAEQRQIDLLLLSNEVDDMSLIERVDDLREDTDNAVGEVLNGYSLVAYKLMRAPGYESERPDADE